MTKISGIYVEIRGDATQLKKELREARDLVTQQAQGMSNALNNALSPAQLKQSINSLTRDLSTLANASRLTGKEFGLVSADLGKLQRITGISEAEFGKLQSRMMQTSAARAQEQALRNIAKAANLSANEIQALGRQMGVNEAGIAAVSSAASSASSSMTLLGAAARTALAYLSAQTMFEFARSVLDAGIAMDSLQRSFAAAAGGQSAGAGTISFLRDEAERLGQNFYELAPEFKNVMAAARGTAMEGEEVRRMFSAIAAASTALSLSADDTHGVLRALQQMMSKGKIQAEELRGQLGERLPGALNLMAKAMGVSTADLNKMMEDGKLLAADALPKLTREIERVYGAAAETAALESAQSAVNRLSQEWTDLKTNMFEADTAVTGINLMTEALRGMNEIVTAIRTGRNKSGEVRTLFDGPGRGDMTGVEGYNTYRGKVAPAGSLSRIRVADPRITGDQFISMQGGMDAAAKRAAELTKEVDKGREGLAKYIQTAREKAKADYENAVRFANSKEEEAKALKVYQEALAAIDKKGAGSDTAAKAMEKLQAEIAKLSMSAADFEHYQIDQEFAKIAKEIGAANPLLAQWVDLRRKEAELTRSKSVDKELTDFFGDIDKQSADLLKKAEDTRQKNEEILLDFSDRYREIVVGETEFKKEQIDRQAEIFRKAGADEVAVAQWVAQEKLAVSREWQDGATRALQSYADEAGNAAKNVEDVMTMAFQGIEDAVVEFVKTGKLEFADLVTSINAEIARLAFRGMASEAYDWMGGLLKTGLSLAGSDFGSGSSVAAGSAGGGFNYAGEMSSFFATHHAGGIAGLEPTSMRAVNPAIFAGADRFHAGGIAGDEVPAILKRGEGVFTEGQMKALGGSDSETRALLREIASGIKAQRGTKVVNAIGKGAIANELSGPEGEQVIFNHIRRNPSAVRRMLGV